MNRELLTIVFFSIIPSLLGLLVIYITLFPGVIKDPEKRTPFVKYKYIWLVAGVIFFLGNLQRLIHYFLDSGNP